MYGEDRRDRATTKSDAFHGASTNPANLTELLSCFCLDFTQISLSVPKEVPIMLGDDSQGIYEFILDRILKIHDKLLPSDPEYQQLGERSDEIRQQLTPSLGPKELALFDDFDCSRAAQMNRQDELIYSRGLMDGIILGSWVERIKRDEELEVP
jgi:hypothetical protein